MIDLDHASLDRVLPATPGPADWDDVLSRSGVSTGARSGGSLRLAAVALVPRGHRLRFGVRGSVRT